MEFKDRIRALRTEKRLTQTQLAAQITKGESAVRMWEIGRSKPDVDTLIKLAEYFDCTTDYLLGLSDVKNADFAKHLDIENEKLAQALDKHANELFMRSGRSFFDILADALNSKMWFWVIMAELSDYIEFDESNNENFKTIFIDKQNKRLVGTPLEIPTEHMLDYVIVSAQNHLRYLFEELRAKKLEDATNNAPQG